MAISAYPYLTDQLSITAVITYLPIRLEQSRQGGLLGRPSN